MTIEDHFWHARFKVYKKAMGYTNSDIAKITGHTTDSIKVMTQPKKDFPRGLRLAIVDFEKNNNKNH